MSRLIKKLINFLLETKINIVIFYKSIKILRNIKTTPIENKIKTGYRKKWKQLGKYPSIRHLKIYSSISGKTTVNFVPENYYYNKIEPILNDKAYVIAYTDKNLFERLIHENSDLFPRTYLRSFNGTIYNSTYELINNTQEYIDSLNERAFIVKPSSFTGGGRDVLLLQRKNNKFLFDNKELDKASIIDYLKKKYKNNFLIQEKIIQHQWFSNFNESSLNTIRMLTYRSVKNESVNILNTVLRYGATGRIVDNQASGGFSIGVNCNGKLNTFAINKLGHRNNNIPLPKNNVVPEYEKMVSLAQRLAPYYFYQRLLGFDFCFTIDEKLKILEINAKNLEINFHQMNNGHLFGEFTDEIIEYCRDAVKTITFNFKIIR